MRHRGKYLRGFDVGLFSVFRRGHEADEAGGGNKVALLGGGHDACGGKVSARFDFEKRIFCRAPGFLRFSRGAE